MASVQHKDDKRKVCGSCRVKKARQSLKKKAVEHLGGKCSRCGYDKCLGALHFHHLDPSEKDFQITNPNTRSWSSIELELKKCILVCANCHSEIHEKENATLVDVVTTMV